MVVCPEGMDASYLDELEEFVKDDGRIVTYKWLSLTLHVPSNVAKQMLHHYASRHQQEGQGTKPPISVTYLVSGLLKDDEGKVKKGEASTSTLKKVVWLVDERDLSAARQSLCAITSVHIYSVQKTAPQDLATLYAAHYDKAKEHISDSHKYSGVSCTFARVNPAEGRIQQVIAEAEPPTEKPSQNTRVAANPSAATTTATTTATTATATATKPSSQIASMFAQQAKKVDAPKKTIVKEEKPPIKKSPGGISAFFTKGAAAPRKAENSEKKKEIKEEIKEEEKEEVKEEIKEMKKKEKDLFVIGKTAEEKVKKSKASTSTQKKRKSQRKEADEPKVKRSRILQISDSESEEEEKEEEEDLLLLPPPPPSPPLTQTIQSDEEEEEEKKKKEEEEEEDRKGKKKIMVDETFMDEDGYLVTNKVYKYVDLTEEEIKEEEKERKREEENRKKREEEAKKREEERRKREEEAGSSPSSPQKKKRGKKDDGKKQSSIMSFFGKK